MLANAQAYSHQVLAQILQEGDYVLDATLGKGHDTAFLAQQVGPSGRVWAFDIQTEAIQASRQRLQAAGLLDRCSLIQDSHAHINSYLDPQETLKAVLFNLGYLPGGEKSLITQASSTLAALDQVLPRMLEGGRIVLVAYWGHEGGLDELTQVKDYVEKLPQADWTVLSYQFINQANCPPMAFVIERRKQK